MKKLSILALAAILVIFFTVPASALENEFGGYWRTRFFSQKYFSGFDRGDRTNDAGDRAEDDTIERTDTRTRLYYTAKINDNLKFVNKFEYDAVWGGSGTYGRVGADTVSIEVKNSYADFNLGPVNFTVGVQPYSLFRDFQISDDASGIIARWKAMDNFVLAGSWLKSFEGGEGDGENEDVDTYTVTGAFWFIENISLKPSISTTYTDELPEAIAGAILGLASPESIAGDDPYIVLNDYSDAYLVTYGADFDMTFDKWGLWVTAFGQVGEVNDVKVDRDGDGAADAERDFDIEAYLVAVGGNMGLGTDLGLGLHGEFFYASGDDDADDKNIEGVVSPFGSYYWSEIMGYGIFDNRASANSPADKITNIWAANIGVDMKPMDKLKVALDLWYAERVEDEQVPNNEDQLGTELDLLITYQLVEGLNLDLVGAYLWADNATADSEPPGAKSNKEDPYEFGARLSLSF